MFRTLRVHSLVAPLTALILAMPLAAWPAQQSQTPPALSGVQTTKQDSDEYGVGGRREVDTDTAGAVLEGRVYDPHGSLREEETQQYATDNGAKRKTEKTIYDFNEKGKLALSVDYKWDLHGGLTSLDMTHYGLHGERSWEQATDYRLDGFKTSDWKSWNHSWTSDFTAYKQTDLAKPSAASQTPIVPTNTSVGVFFPKSFQAGDTITGSLALGSYADHFKGIPGLNELSFPIQLYNLPDGSPQWSSLQIGVQGDGYTPVNPDGQFSLHIPINWKGPLQLQARQPDPVTGLGPSFSKLDLGDSVAAPAMPQNLLSAAARAEMQYWMTEDLIDLWNEAFDLENELDDYYETHATPDPEVVAEIKEDIDDTYDDIDELTSHLPTEVVVKLARGLAKKNRDINEQLRKGNLTADGKVELTEYDDWASFLEDEADNAAWMGVFGRPYLIEPYWTSPVLTENKLGALRGSFSGDSYDTPLYIDKFPITPMASTPDVLYFMPPPGLAPGLHNYQIDSPWMPQTALPVFYMNMTMWADQLNLHKGQSTTYHLKLDGLNGLPSSSWNSSFFPSDLVSPSEWQASQPNTPLPGTSRTGIITLSVTNESPGTIAMLNSFHILDAQSFAPSGWFQLDGGVGAIKDGGFSILGVARAYLQPEEGLGLNSKLPAWQSYGPTSSGWLPSGGWNYTPDSPTSSGFTTHCPTSATSGDSGSSTAAPASSECMGSTAYSLYEDAVGGSSATVGNPPDFDRDEAARKLRLAAQKREWAAKKKAEDARADVEKKRSAVDDAWENGVDHAPDANREEYRRREERVRKADDEVDRTTYEHDLSKKRPVAPSDDELYKLARAESDARVEQENARNSLRRYRREIQDKFTKADRDAYDAARAAVEAAERAAAKAGAELRDARAEGGPMEKAPDDSEPSPPRVPIG